MSLDLEAGETGGDQGEEGGQGGERVGGGAGQAKVLQRLEKDRAGGLSDGGLHCVELHKEF